MNNGGQGRAQISGWDANRETTKTANRACGDRALTNLFDDLVYERLCGVASRLLRSEGREHLWQAQDLVHDAFLRIARSRTCIDFQSSSQVVALAVVVMRHILIDRTRSTGISARHRRVYLEQDFRAELFSPWQNIALNHALEQLAQVKSRCYLVVHLRFFAGFEMEEIASELAISTRTVKRDWRAAQIWLRQALSAGAAFPGTASPNLAKCNSDTGDASRRRQETAAHSLFHGSIIENYWSSKRHTTEVA